MRVLITGNCGYVGSVLTKKCLEKGYEVVGYDKLMHGKEHLEEFEKNSNLKIIVGDIRDLSKLDDLIKESSAVIHLAGIARVDNPFHLEKEMEEVNRDASIYIASTCRKYGKKFIFVSSCSVYGLAESEKLDEESEISPTTIYARTKAEAEKGIITVNPDALIVRPATAYGPSPRPRYDLFINEMLRDALIKNKISLFDPDTWRCYVHTEDFADALLFLLEKNSLSHKIYNIGSDEQNITKRQIVEVLKEEIGDFEVEILRERKDTRNYKVSFERLSKEGFKAMKNMPIGIKEMKEQLLSLDNPFDIKFTNYK